MIYNVVLVSGVRQSDSVIHIHVSILWMALAAENPPASEGDLRDTGSIPGLGRSPGGGHGNLLQYFCLEGPMNRRVRRATVHGVAKELDTTYQLKNNNKVLIKMD